MRSASNAHDRLIHGGPMPPLNRRHFLQHSAFTFAAATASSAALGADEAPAKAPPSERVQVGCIGVGGRASGLMHGFATLKEVDIVRLCDIDHRKLPGAAGAVSQRTGKKPAIETDFRRIVDDPEID